MNSLASKLLIDFTVKKRGQLWYLVSVCAMLSILIFFNYYGHGQFISNADYYRSYFFTFLAFAFSFFLQAIFLNRNFLQKPSFWILLFLAPAIFTIRSKLSESGIFVSTNKSLYPASISYLLRATMLILPVYLFWRVRHKHQVRFYCGGVDINWNLVFLVLPIAPILVIYASQQNNFISYYPKAVQAAGLSINSNIFNWLLFELCYALDFLGIEIFFRGFLIIAFVRYVGVMAIVPAACFYCCIHFGKPMPEAISSFFGGLLLGIISYHSRNIWTSFLIHLLMAWLMELTSFCFYQL